MRIIRSHNKRKKGNGTNHCLRVMRGTRPPARTGSTQTGWNAHGRISEALRRRSLSLLAHDGDVASDGVDSRPHLRQLFDQGPVFFGEGAHFGLQVGDVSVGRQLRRFVRAQRGETRPRHANLVVTMCRIPNWGVRQSRRSQLVVLQQLPIPALELRSSLAQPLVVQAQLLARSCRLALELFQLPSGDLRRLGVDVRQEGVDTLILAAAHTL
mmetsp:Transcript_35734/g.107985  ORF Transcript_35734/g.107985 Transcript_35734/m.107985 type:complete len:212 (+) Transcript_35734:152-787(+)